MVAVSCQGGPAIPPQPANPPQPCLQSPPSCSIASSRRINSTSRQGTMRNVYADLPQHHLLLLPPAGGPRHLFRDVIKLNVLKATPYTGAEREMASVQTKIKQTPGYRIGCCWLLGPALPVAHYLGAAPLRARPAAVFTQRIADLLFYSRTSFWQFRSLEVRSHVVLHRMALGGSWRAQGSS